MAATRAQVEHRALLITVDVVGTETVHDLDDPRALGLPAVASSTDDEEMSLPPGRRWGCACGWRGPLRDVSSRHYRPKVDDRGHLGARRVARLDRDTRAALDEHLAEAARPATGPSPVSAGGQAHRTSDESPPAGRPVPARVRPRRPRRPLTMEPAAAPEKPEPPEGPEGHEPLEVSESGDDTAAATADPPCPAAAGDEAVPGEPPPGTLEGLAATVQDARRALTRAEAALDEAVHEARTQGASWRAIARRTDTDRRSAQQRWGSPDESTSL